MNVDPQTPATVYAATLAGLFKPLNGGVAWAQHTPRVFGVPAIDPETPTTLYGGGGLAGLRGPFKSTDGGATWKAVQTEGRYFLSRLLRMNDALWALGQSVVMRQTGPSEWKKIDTLVPNAAMTGASLAEDRAK